MIGDWSVIEKYIQTFILEFIDQLLYILTRLIIAAYDIVKKSLHMFLWPSSIHWQSLLGLCLKECF